MANRQIDIGEIDRLLDREIDKIDKIYNIYV